MQTQACARSSLTEHQELEVPLGAPRLVLCLAGVEARIALLDPGEVEGPGPVQEAVTASLGHLGRRGQREPVTISNGETEAQLVTRRCRALHLEGLRIHPGRCLPLPGTLVHP